MVEEGMPRIHMLPRRPDLRKVDQRNPRKQRGYHPKSWLLLNHIVERKDCRFHPQRNFRSFCEEQRGNSKPLKRVRVHLRVQPVQGGARSTV